MSMQISITAWANSDSSAEREIFHGKKPFEWPDYPCPECGFEKQWLVGKAKNSGGHNVCVFYCGYCSHRTTHFVACQSVIDAGVEPCEIKTTWKLPSCEVCGKEGAENHHWAPYALFGGESEKWPRSYLCQECHSKWHRIVTPNMRCAD